MCLAGKGYTSVYDPDETSVASQNYPSGFITRLLFWNQLYLTSLLFGSVQKSSLGKNPANGSFFIFIFFPFSNNSFRFY